MLENNMENINNAVEYKEEVINSELENTAKEIVEGFVKEYEDAITLENFKIKGISKLGKVDADGLPEAVPENTGTIIEIQEEYTNENGEIETLDITLISSGKNWYVMPPTVTVEGLLNAVISIDMLSDEEIKLLEESM